LFSLKAVIIGSSSLGTSGTTAMSSSSEPAIVVSKKLPMSKNASQTFL
jgi:hypothetical protein